MGTNELNCDAAELSLLLTGDETSDEFQQVAEHVDTCPSCQQSLTKLAGEESAWSDISDLLSDFPGSPSTDATFSDLSANDSSFAGEPAVHVNVDFLAAPSHPEMLGRLGRYEIERVVGSGGMGIVLKGFDSELNRPVAIKVLANHLCGSGPARKRFEREARAAAAVADEHVVAIHNVESDDDTPYIVMQFVPGESLQDRVEREGPLPAKEVLRIGMQSASGLAAAHEQGVVHRDIKPANILLENGMGRALVTDFGLARTVDDASLTHTGMIAGTPHYMSPEQAGGEAIDHRTDLFSLGSVLYFMATGRPPFRADKAMGVLHRICHDRHRSACEVNTDVPYELSDLIDQLLEKKARYRIDSSAQLRQRLSDQLADLQSGRHRGRFHSLHRSIRRQWKQIAVAAGIIAVTLGLAMVTLHQSVPDSDVASESSPQATGESNETSADHQVAETDSTLAARRVQEELLKAEAALSSEDADQVDSQWSAEIKLLHKKLDWVQQGMLPE